MPPRTPPLHFHTSSAPGTRAPSPLSPLCRRQDALRLLLRQPLAPVVWGAAIGVALFAGLGLLLTGALIGISPWDPVAFIAMPLVLLAVALLAAWLPARRSLAADAVAVLRCE